MNIPSSPILSFPTIICGDFHTLMITTSGSIVSFGSNYHYNLGHKESNIFPPKEIPNLTNIYMISCGLFHSVCLNCNGDVYSFGSNDNGTLGLGKVDFEKTYIPYKINIPHCKQVSCGDKFTICVTTDGLLYSFGSNDLGQLGIGNDINQSTPQQIDNINNVEFIECGGRHTLCKTYDNTYYAWGYGDSGQLGIGDSKSYNNPTLCTTWPDNIISFKCGAFHSVFLTLNGFLYSCGSNDLGQLGINNMDIYYLEIPTLLQDIPLIKRIECGVNHCLCIDIDNNLWGFGDNYNGQLGLGVNENGIKIKQNTNIDKVIDISQGGEHSFIKTINNEIFSFGKNDNCQLGLRAKKNIINITPQRDYEENMSCSNLFTTSFSNTNNISISNLHFGTSTLSNYQRNPVQVFKDEEHLWCSNIGKTTQKSARK